MRGVLAAWLVVAVLSAGFAHTVAASAPTQGGVVLDRYGGLRTFGGASLDTSGAGRWSWDIARAVTLAPSGGGWTLDGWGGAHPFGGAPALTGLPYWYGWDIARALVVLPDGHSGYVLDGWGTIHQFGGAPALSGEPFWQGQDMARGLDVHLDSSGTPDGGAVLDAAGGLHPFGTYPYSLTAPPSYPGRDMYVGLHDVGGHVYAVGRFGIVTEVTTGGSLAPDWSGYADSGADDGIRDVVLAGATGGGAQPVSFMARYAWQQATGPRGGAVLDGYGGLHPFGGLSLDMAGASYWPNWDIARSVALMPGGAGGWTLDAWGGIHPFGAAPALSGYPVWHGWDIARALVVNPDGHSGYEMDAYGGLHPFGGAPQLNGAPYWSGWYIATGLVVHYDSAGTPDGGWTLDAWGGTHNFGAAPAAPGPQYWAGRLMYIGLHATYGGDMYAIGRWGPVSATTGENFRPWWSGYSDWGSWDILRDIALVGDDSTARPSQPVSADASSTYWHHVWVYNFNIGPVRQGLPLDCESAALEEATRAKGNDISQYTIFNALPNYDKGPATWSGGHIAQWGDPYGEFVGNVYGSESRGTGYGVYDPPLVAVARQFGFNAVGVERGGPEVVFNAIAMGQPVLIITSDTYTPVATYWWTAYDGRAVPYSLSDHAVTIVSEDGVAGTITLNDVWDGRMKTFTMSQFASFWTAYLDMAVILQ
ncbi:MAG: C39 family peptidase [Candidatus Dormibacteraeota bacterium]|nr:C39 family peptidase [Candidatus Dormibacteraeota bacterium]